MNANGLRDLVLKSTDITFRPDSPLYVHLGTRLADDPELLEIVAAIPRGQPILNLFFAAVQYLQLRSPELPLADYYPSVSGRSAGAGDAYAAFRSFVLARRQEIEPILATRRVQTNETGRCAIALPVYGLVAQRTGLPLTIIEVGCSAGLNLIWDRYRYVYSDGGDRRQLGPLGAGLELHCAVDGGTWPPLPATYPRVADRVGLDLQPIDVTTDDGALWARAMLWPDQPDRHRRMEAAISEFRAAPARLVAGDGIDDLEEVVALLPDAAALCLLHTFVLNQMPRRRRDDFDAVLAAISHDREVFRVSIEWLTEERTKLELMTYHKGVRRDEVLARNHPHGMWIDWLGRG